MNKFTKKFFDKLFGYQEPTDFMANEAKRYFEDDCEVQDTYNNDGRVYTEGQCIVKENNEIIVKHQAKLINTGLLS